MYCNVSNTAVDVHILTYVRTNVQYSIHSTTFHFTWLVTDFQVQEYVKRIGVLCYCVRNLLYLRECVRSFHCFVGQNRVYLITSFTQKLRVL